MRLRQAAGAPRPPEAYRQRYSLCAPPGAMSAKGRSFRRRSSPDEGDDGGGGVVAPAQAPAPRAAPRAARPAVPSAVARGVAALDEEDDGGGIPDAEAIRCATLSPFSFALGLAPVRCV